VPSTHPGEEVSCRYKPFPDANHAPGPVFLRVKCNDLNCVASNCQAKVCLLIKPFLVAHLNCARVAGELCGTFFRDPRSLIDVRT